MVRKFARVEGKVQGVGFRYFVQISAHRLNITGWVKNELDGTVSIEMQGTEEQLKSLEKIINEGNGMSKVTQLHVENIFVVDDEERFVIRR